MAKVVLAIELDAPREVWHPGDTVTGNVSVTTDASVRCDALTIELLWQTHGQGNTARGTPQSLQLYSGEWTGATSARYPFSFTMPAGPVTYHGHYLNVGWFLRARADVPWKLDPKAELELALRAGPGEHQKIDPRLQRDARWQRLESELRGRSGTPPKTPSFLKITPSAVEGGKPSVEVKWRELGSNPAALVLGCGCLGVLLFFFGGPVMFLLWGAKEGVTAAIEGRWEDAVPGLLFALVLLIGIATLVAAVVRHRMKKSGFGNVVFDLQPERVSPGQSVRVRGSFTPARAMELTRAVVVLTGRERVTSGSGTSSRTRTHELHAAEFELSPARRLSPGLPFEVAGELKIPADAAPSFAAEDNELSWSIRLDFEVARFPDWSQTRDLVVTP